MHVDLHLATGAAAEAERAALHDLLGSRLNFLAAGQPAADAPDRALAPVVWWHGAGAGGAAEVLRGHLDAGGRALLSGDAVLRLGELGVEGGPLPAAAALPPGAAGAALGLVGMPGRPPFHRVAGGVLLGGPRDAPAAVWTPPDWPRDGRVLAVLRSGDTCLAELPGLVEYAVGSSGRLLVCTVPLAFADNDPRYAERRARCFGDLFDYLAADALQAGGPHWPDPGARRGMTVVAVSGDEAPMAALPAASPPTDDAAWSEADVALAAAVAVAAPDGQLLRARSDGHLDALCARGFRALRDLRLQVAAADAAPAEAARPVVRCRVHPAGIDWEFAAAAGAMHLRPADDGQGFCLTLRAGAAPLDVALDGCADLAVAPPYPDWLAGPPQVATARHGGVLVARSAVLGVAAVVAADLRPTRAVLREEAAGGVAFHRTFRVGAGDELTISLDGRGHFGALYATAEPRTAYHDVDATLRLASADAGGGALDAAVAPVRGHLATLRGPLSAAIGPASIARLGAGAPRFAAAGALDAHETLLAHGRRAVVAGDLRLCARCQDADGRIPDFVHASGFAADGGAVGTAAFVAGVARWLAWTDDLRLVAELAPAVRRALAALRRFDFDDDGLCEGLRPAEPVDVRQVTWEWRAWSAAAALAALPGGVLGDDDAQFAADCRQRAEHIRAQLRAVYWQPGDGSFALRPGAGGREDAAPSCAAAALPWVHGLGEPGHEAAALRRFASAAHQADWGSRESPADDAEVTPRATAWTVQADFVHGRADAAWSRWLGLLHAPHQGVPGLVAERWDGQRARACGASQDLAGHAAVLGGLVPGLLGLRALPDEVRLVFEPSLPGSLDGVGFELPVGALRCRGRLARGAGGRDLHLDLGVEGDGELDLEFAPFVAAPAVCGAVELGGEPIDSHVEDCGDGVRVRGRITLAAGEHRLHFHVTPDLLLELPAAQRPATDAVSGGPRYLGRRLLDGGDAVQLDLELATDLVLPVRTPGRRLQTVDGAERLDEPAPGREQLRVVPGPGVGPRRARVVLRFDAAADAGQ